MLTKLLPELNLKLKALKLPLKPKTADTPNSSQPLPSSPNLINPESAIDLSAMRGQMARIFIFASILPPLIFLGTVSYRFSLSRQIKSAQDQKEDLTIYLKRQDQVYRDALVTVKKVSLLKENWGAGEQMAGRIDAALSAVPSNIDILNLESTAQGITIKVQNPSALSVAHLILSYFEAGKVKEVSITSAEFDSQGNVYKVTLDLSF